MSEIKQKHEHLHRLSNLSLKTKHSCCAHHHTRRFFNLLYTAHRVDPKLEANDHRTIIYDGFFKS